jgi:hypothetical protein
LKKVNAKGERIAITMLLAKRNEMMFGERRERVRITKL